MIKIIRLLTLPIVCIGIIISFSNCGDNEETPSNQIKDIDGNVYTSVTIGTQVWMVQNLKVTRYNNGESIAFVEPESTDWGSLTTGAYSNDYEETNVNGRLYNWYAVNDARGLAPEGWHVATLAEWNTLIDFLGGVEVAGSALKEKGVAHWCSPNSDATNATGFTALPGDWRLDIGFGTGCGDSPFWIRDAYDAEQAYNLFLFDGSGEVSIVYNTKFTGWGVRCIKN